MGGSKKVDANALINDRLRSMNEALSSGGPLPDMSAGLDEGKCIVEFEKLSNAVMEDVGTFMIKLVRLGDTSKQVNTPSLETYKISLQVSVKLDTIDGTADAGDDYIEVHEVVTFEVGQEELEFEMEIVDDDEWEPDEEFYVKVSLS